MVVISLRLTLVTTSENSKSGLPGQKQHIITQRAPVGDNKRLKAERSFECFSTCSIEFLRIFVKSLRIYLERYFLKDYNFQPPPRCQRISKTNVTSTVYSIIFLKEFYQLSPNRLVAFILIAKWFAESAFQSQKIAEKVK